jgi:hypothetical protein
MLTDAVAEYRHASAAPGESDRSRPMTGRIGMSAWRDLVVAVVERYLTTQRVGIPSATE